MQRERVVFLLQFLTFPKYMHIKAWIVSKANTRRQPWNRGVGYVNKRKSINIYMHCIKWNVTLKTELTLISVSQ